MSKRTMALLLAVVVLASMIPMAAGAAPTYVVGEAFPVSLADGGQVQPDIDFPWIVWKTEPPEESSDSTDIMAYNFMTGEESIVCTAAGEQSNPSISGDWVTYSDDRVEDGYCAIYAYNLATGEERVISDIPMVYQGNPAIDGDLIVHNHWDTLDPERYGDIWAYDLSTETTWAVCEAPGYQREAEIADGWVTWRDGRMGYESVWGYDLEASEEVTIALGASEGGLTVNYYDPSTGDGLVAAKKQTSRSGFPTMYSIMLIDPLTGVETTISTVNDESNRWHPSIDDGWVVWPDRRSGRVEVYGYDIESGEETCLVPAVLNDSEDWEYGGRAATADGIVAWHDHRLELDDLGVPLNNDGVDTYDDLYAMFLRPVEVEYTPVEGDDRFGTAVQVSEDAFPEGADTVVIATGLNFPDALAGSSLAGVYGAPVLLVGGEIPDVVADEIDRLGASSIFILGGEDAVSAGIEEALTDMELEVTRLGGVDRFETANLIAEETLAVMGDAWDGTAFVATGYDYPDALSAGPLAAYAGYPIFLGGPEGVSDETEAAMDDLGVLTAYVLGGPDVITLGEVEGLKVTALAGADRYETAAVVAEFGSEEIGLSWTPFALATGDRFPDALTAGAAQGIMGGTLLITPTASLDPAISDAIDAHATEIWDVNYIGGLLAISQDVRDAVDALLY